MPILKNRGYVMPNYKYTLKNGKTMCMPPSTIQTGLVKINIPVNEDLKHNGMQKSLNGNFLTSRILPVIFYSPVL